MKLKVAEVIRLAMLGKEQFDYLLRKLEIVEYYSPGVEYHLNTDNIADLFVQMLHEDEIEHD